MASLLSNNTAKDKIIEKDEIITRSIYIFKAFIKITPNSNFNNNKKYYSKQDAFMNNLKRYYNPFQHGPRVVIYSKQNDRVVGVLYARGLPSSTTFVEQECILLKPTQNSWQPLDNLDYGIYLKSYQVELKDWYVYEKSLDTSDAMITTYNVAHLLGERKNMGNSNNKELNCFSKNIEDKKLFYKFHAMVLYNLQSDVILLQEMPGVYHNKAFTNDNILKPIVEEMNKMLETESNDNKGRNQKMQQDKILRYNYISLCEDNRYWHTYGIISRLNFCDFTQQTPVICQGICGITLELLNKQHVRLYTSHLHYQPYVKNYQLEEVQEHIKYIKNEAAVVYHLKDCNLTTTSAEKIRPKYDYILWGGDFNNKSLLSYNMQTIINYGQFTPQPYFYVDTFFLNTVNNIFSMNKKKSRNDESNKMDDIMSKKFHILQVGDQVLCKYPNYREKNDHPYFIGIVKSFEINVANPSKTTCTITYNDGDVAAGVEINELYYSPDCPYKDIGTNTSHRFNYIEDLLQSYQYSFKIYSVYSCSNNIEIYSNDFRWYWTDKDCFNNDNDDDNASVKIINDDAHNIISYYGPIANYQTHKYYLDSSDELYGNGCHSDHLPISICISIK